MAPISLAVDANRYFVVGFGNIPRDDERIGRCDDESRRHRHLVKVVRNDGTGQIDRQEHEQRA